MGAPPLELKKAIDEALEQTRTELLRLYEYGYTGSVTVHCGKNQLRVKATPERACEPIILAAQQ